jgi:hypothetical protein
MELKTPRDLSAHPDSEARSARAQLADMIGGYWVSQICGTTARLGLADHLVGGPRTILDLATITSADADGLGRLLRAAATVGLFAELDGDRFELAPLGEQLLDGDPAGSLRDRAIALTAPGHWLTYGRLLEAVVSGETQAHAALGMDVWDYYASHEEERRHFARTMTSFSAEVSRAVVGAYDVTRFRRVIDVGGSQGVLLSALLSAAPPARGVLFDLPEVIAGAQASLGGNGQADRIEFVGGDFFEGVPDGGDLYVLKSVLHDWDDERAAQILRNVHRASAPGSRLAVIECPLPARPGPSHVHLANLLMLVQLGGRERTLAEYDDLLAEAGYDVDRTISAATSTYPWTVLEAVRR